LRSRAGAERIETGARLHAGGVDLDVPLAPSVADDLLTVIEREAIDDHQTRRATDNAAC
jgi:hypothetical protein